MNNIEDLEIVIVGLGYVGLPLAIEFSKKFKVVGFDINSERISELTENYDRTNEVSKDILNTSSNILFTSDVNLIKNANIYIVTVPTPVDKNNNPDLGPLTSATTLVAQVLEEGNIVVYESTVYPGCTEEECVPLLEKHSNLIYNSDFFVGYSPERINPGDKEHTLTNIVKITSGSTAETASIVDEIYQKIIKAGTYMASSISVAEAAKVIENTQRDVNIALINELALIFHKLGISTKEVLQAASTKWNFLPFSPGLVGGHCIGVDPYYLTHRAVEYGYHPEIILAGRRINDNMGYYIAETLFLELAKLGVKNVDAKVSILGLTFKENCPDLRNTKVSTIVSQVRTYNCQLLITDSWASKNEVENYFNIEPCELENIENQDAIIIAVNHNEYLNFSNEDWLKMLKPGGLIIDVKSIYKKSDFNYNNITYWSL